MIGADRDDDLTALRSCSVCGCTDADACVDENDRTCSWMPNDPDVCSFCAEDAAVRGMPVFPNLSRAGFVLP